jgi:hypothetical protein
MHSNNRTIREQAFKEWKNLYDKQKDPEENFFDGFRFHYKNIQLECPIWSHVRMANPRKALEGLKRLIFRRGYLYMEGGSNGRFSSGLLFICFQRDIKNGFEYIKTNFLNDKNFPLPEDRKFSPREQWERRLRGQLGTNSQKSKVGINTLSSEPDSNGTGKDGLSRPSELGIFPRGLFPITVSQGGGYYFVPPIPKRIIADIAEQFFD